MSSVRTCDRASIRSSNLEPIEYDESITEGTGGDKENRT
jgi:hypothetical protein